MDLNKLLADRTRKVTFSGIRKFFELAGRMKNPCDLSIGQPDYDAPEAVKLAAIQAIEKGHNRYTPSAGIPELGDRIRARLKASYDIEPGVLVTSGVSGALTLALLATVQAGDEVVFLDPYFVSYLQLVNLVGGTPVPVDSYPDFKFRSEAVEAAITPRTKILLINSPGNPTGCVMSSEEIQAAAAIARKNDLLLISDEIYDQLAYDGELSSPVEFAAENTLLIRGYGKTYGMTGWRMGYAAGPAALIAEMTKLQQYTYVCAPSMAQYATLTALETDVSHHRREYARKRDLVCGLLENDFELTRPSGGFYVFPRIPPRFEDADSFVAAVAEHDVLVIPGHVFSGRKTHFRVSYATSDEMIHRGCEALCAVARGR